MLYSIIEEEAPKTKEFSLHDILKDQSILAHKA